MGPLTAVLNPAGYAVEDGSLSIHVLGQGQEEEVETSEPCTLIPEF
jgi:hypothetical protein